MAIDETLSDRIRELLVDQEQVEEKKMFGGVCFMVNDKMCVGITNKGQFMVRLNPDQYEAALERPGCEEMDFTGKPMKGFVFVDATGTDRQEDLKWWIDQALDYNALAKPAKKRKK